MRLRRPAPEEFEEAILAERIDEVSDEPGGASVEIALAVAGCVPEERPIIQQLLDGQRAVHPMIAACVPGACATQRGSETLEKKSGGAARATDEGSNTWASLMGATSRGG